VANGTRESLFGELPTYTLGHAHPLPEAPR
jgi:hypothetical protein